jgi:hypothetical protein
MLSCRLMLKYLRIAVTALSLVACMLLVALWVRSYRYSDSIPIKQISSGKRLDVNSSRGRISVQLTTTRQWWNNVKSRAVFVPEKGYEIEGESGYFDGDGRALQSGIVKAIDQGMSHWFVVLLLSTFAAVIWLPWRFSLRTLLIATTLVAVGLGLIVLL